MNCWFANWLDGLRYICYSWQMTVLACTIHNESLIRHYLTQTVETALLNKPRNNHTSTRSGFFEWRAADVTDQIRQRLPTYVSSKTNNTVRTVKAVLPHTLYKASCVILATSSKYTESFSAEKTYTNYDHVDWEQTSRVPLSSWGSQLSHTARYHVAGDHAC